MASQSLFSFVYIVFLSVQNLGNSDSLILKDSAEEIRGVWTWIGGSKQRNQKNAIDHNQQYPGSRYEASSWLDSNGTVWIFGGRGAESRKPLDELWSFDASRRQWHFHEFNKTLDTNEQKPPPSFGATSCSFGNKDILVSCLGTFIFRYDKNQWTVLNNQTESPQPRSHAASWCDTKKGILFIFGGYSKQRLGDFWKFSLEEMKWTEIKVNTSVVPSSRSKASAWIHHWSGDLYMFGGSTNAGLTSEFWKFSLETSEWMKVSGTTGQDKCAGKYGKQGVLSSTNHPGCREGAASWIYKGHLCLFGGSGFDNFSRGIFAMSDLLSDFWVYNTSISHWVWIGGLSRGEGIPFFGEKGKQDVHAIPGPREGATSFSIGETLWLFGGNGHDVKQYDGFLNDLWMWEQITLDIRGDTILITSHTPGDTIHVSFGFRVLIAIFILILALVGTIITCYSKECRFFHLKRGLRPVVKYKPVEVEMIQVAQPELHAPLEEPASRNL
ncbi:PREDICTED: uncharacterized protein LOC107349685 [Acropora digitifera]|uniref:uncharacterized protein LOC107349685 n=1 Tax=Acropora digitifera TaxID=70779 RepID=UPI00077AA1EC|nr:PREDICTED: uncharacterized protein LOC107349685 [Acropora digitifera]